MSWAFFRSARPLLFAHRGGAGLAPENTLAAFDRAHALGVDGLELDVRLARDGVVVVHHDHTLERTTNLRGPVHSYGADELARADAGWHFPCSGDGRGEPAFPYRGQGIGVPALEEVLRRYPDLRVIIELKQNNAALADAVLETVRSARADDRVCLGGFGWWALAAARRRAPQVATSACRHEVRWALYRSWARWPVRHVPYGGYQVPEVAGHTRVVSPRFVRDAHAAGLAVHVWTVDDPAVAQRLLDWGVDALISDRPDRFTHLTLDAGRGAREPTQRRDVR